MFSTTIREHGRTWHWRQLYPYGNSGLPAEDLLEAAEAPLPITIHFLTKVDEIVDRLERLFRVAIELSNVEAIVGDLVVVGILESDAC